MKLLIIALIALAAGQAPPSAPSNQAPIYSHSKQGRVQSRDPRAPRAIPHQATLNYANSSCVTAKLCNIQVYRSTCTSASSCPAYTPGASGWTQLASGTAAATPSPTGTTWVVTDTDTALQDATTYVWVATNSFQSNSTTYSAASPPWSGTTSAAPTAPPAPTNGTGNTIQ